MLGTGLFQGVLPSHITVTRAAGGEPEITLLGTALRVAEDLGITRVTVSITTSATWSPPSPPGGEPATSIEARGPCGDVGAVRTVRELT